MGCVCETLVGKNVEISPLCIGNLWIFENLRPEELEALVGAAQRKRYQENQSIFVQGDPASEMFLVKGGRIRLSKVLEDGNEITLDIRKAGDFLGEYVLNEDMDYPVSAWCMEETLLCGFTKKQFEQLVLKYPNIGLHVIRNLSKRISTLTSRVGSLSIHNLVDRLYGVLINMAKEHGSKSRHGSVIPFPLTHEDLSFLVGAHRVSVTRAMKDLKTSGKIIQEGRQIIVCDAADFN